jgi:hypothetical protein
MFLFAYGDPVSLAVGREGKWMLSGRQVPDLKQNGDYAGRFVACWKC